VLGKECINPLCVFSSNNLKTKKTKEGEEEEGKKGKEEGKKKRKKRGAMVAGTWSIMAPLS